MRVHYQLAGTAHDFDTDAEDLSAMCRNIEDHLRLSHPELSDLRFLTERIADGMLNALAGDAEEVELGDLLS